MAGHRAVPANRYSAMLWGALLEVWNYGRNSLVHCCAFANIRIWRQRAKSEVCATRYYDAA
jgi:hypothetical protein